MKTAKPTHKRWITSNSYCGDRVSFHKTGRIRLMPANSRGQKDTLFASYDDALQSAIKYWDTQEVPDRKKRIYDFRPVNDVEITTKVEYLHGYMKRDPMAFLVHALFDYNRQCNEDRDTEWLCIYTKQHGNGLGYKVVKL